jgi:hypothetical protein
MQNKRKTILVIGSVLLGTKALAVQHIITKDLGTHGINSEIIEAAFRNTHGINLNINEILKVSADEEGSNYKFDTLDGISVVVPIIDTKGAANKVMPPGPAW